MPDVLGYEYMTALLAELGIVSSGGMGIAPLSWQEIDAFNRCGHLELTSWETMRLMDMSRAYCNWNSKGGEQTDIALDIPYINRDRGVTDYLLRQHDESLKDEPL